MNISLHEYFHMRDFINKSKGVCACVLIALPNPLTTDDHQKGIRSEWMASKFVYNSIAICFRSDTLNEIHPHLKTNPKLLNTASK